MPLPDVDFNRGARCVGDLAPEQAQIRKVVEARRIELLSEVTENREL
jgi:hypothetical protein